MCELMRRTWVRRFSPAGMMGVRLGAGLCVALLVAALLVGCSSGTRRRRAPDVFPPRYAEDEDDKLPYDEMQPGDDPVELRADGYAIRYEFADQGKLDSMTLLGEAPTNFTFEIDEQGRTRVTLENDDRRFEFREGQDGHEMWTDGPWSYLEAIQPDDSLGILAARHFDYVQFGGWAVYGMDWSGDTPWPTDGYTMRFRQGLRTRPAGLPQNTTAVYSATDQVMIGEGYHSVYGPFELTADSLEISVDFGTGELDGEITEVWAAEVLPVIGLVDGGAIPEFLSFNDIELKGDVWRQDATFSGHAKTGARRESPVSFGSGREGDLWGEFYGPAAEEIGGMWHLKDGPNWAIGVFGAPEQ